MIKNIRNNVFETNSSSTHSVSFNFSKDSNESLCPYPPDDNGNIILCGGNFSYDFELISPEDKANLIAAYIIIYCDFELKKRFDKILLEHSGAKEIIYDIRLTVVDGKQPNTFFNPQIIDADSFDDLKNEYSKITFKDIIKDNELLRQFLFAKSSYFIF